MTGVRDVFGPRITSVGLVYLLLMLDNLAWIAIPALTGAALDGMIQAQFRPLLALVVLWIAGSLLSSFRQSYDTRVFTEISSEFAARVAVRQAADGKSISVVSARSGLSRELISFFAQELPMVCRGSVTALGSLLIIFAYDTRAGIACSAVLLPVAVANAWYFKRSRSVNRRLNNRLEREITALRTERERTIRRHYRALSRRRIILSDSEAATSLVMRLAALAAIILLILNMSAGPSSPGEMYALLAYAMMFFTGLVDIPLFVGAVGRYRDIMERLG